MGASHIPAVRGDSDLGKTHEGLLKSEDLVRYAPNTSRTAVCVSGQIRSLNMQPGSPGWPTSWWRQWLAHIPAGVEQGTVAETLHTNLFSALDDFDVFMTISTREGEREPRVGDLSACEPLQPRNPLSRLFCEVLPERTLWSDSQVWSTFYYRTRALQEGLLQQLYGMWHHAAAVQRRTSATDVDSDPRAAYSALLVLPHALVAGRAVAAVVRHVPVQREREIMCLLETKGSSCKKSRPMTGAA